MMNLTKINGKDMEAWLKRGMGTVEISNLLEISSESLIEQMEKSFSSNAVKRYKRKLSKNDKKEKNTMEGTTETLETIENEKKEITLDDLIEEESIQQIITAKQEIAVKETIQQYRQVLEEVIVKSDLLTSLISRIASLRVEIDQLEEAAITALENHDIEIEKLHEEQEKLKKLRDEISKRRVINVFLYKDGSIMIENRDSSVEPEFEGWRQKKEILEDQYEEIVSDLPLKYVKQLAKLMSLPVLDEQKYEISIELPEVEEAYNKIIAIEKEA